MTTAETLPDALRRLGFEQSERDAKAVRRHLELSGADVPDDEMIKMAMEEIAKGRSFHAEGHKVVLAAIPGLRRIESKGGGFGWLLERRYPIREDRRELRVLMPLVGRALAILRAMENQDDPDLDLADLSVIVAGHRERIDASLAPFVEEVRSKIEDDLGDMPEEASVYLGELTGNFLKRAYSFEGKSQKEIRGSFARARGIALAAGIRAGEARRLKETVDIGNFIQRYAQARSMGRRLVFHVGPTNSGKTYAALETLAAARTGVYLAPLRLLALENYESLKERGVAAGMVTGEEEIDVEGATHISQTIETLNIRREVDVAVIDEIQMLGDRDRGWAWTNAVFGIPAKVVIMCGAEEAMSRVVAAAEAAGEELEIVRFERKTPLHVIEKDMRLADVRPGDALVAFSRRDVHEYRLRMLAAGHSVSTIYGALSPEVRRSEAARFREGEAEVLVTTDAIGMGLNLGPLKRVVFTTLTKWDGVQERDLSPEEIRQIAGRAGRYGFHEAGEVATMVRGGGPIVRRALGKIRDRGIRKFYVKPDMDAVRAVADEIGSSNLAEVLRRFAAGTFYEGSPFISSDLDETIAAASMMDRIDMTIEDKFAFAICPVDRRNPEAVNSLRMWASLHASGRRVPAPSASPYAHLAMLEGDVRLASAYLWLSRRFPATFYDVESALAARSVGNEAIEAELRNTAQARVVRRAKA